MLTVSLVGRLLLRLRLRWAAAPLLIVSAFAFGGNVFLDEQTLTGDQQAQLLPGRFDASASLLGIAIPAGKPYLTDTQESLQKAGLPVTVSLQVIDFPAYSVAEDGIYFREMDWTTAPFPGVYSVTNGRMPRNPGEVAVAARGADVNVSVGDNLSTLGQTDGLKVVGLVKPRLTNNAELLAAPGTLAGLRPGRTDLSSSLTSSPTFFFHGSVNRNLIEDLARVLRQSDPTDFGVSTSSLVRIIDQAIRTTADARADVDKPWTQRSALLFFVPVLTLFPLAILLCLHGLWRYLGPAMRIMAMQGVRRRTIFAIGFTTTLTTVLLGIVSGAIVGSLGGHFGAQVDAWSSPAAVWRLPTAAVSATGLGLLLGAVGCAALLSRRHRASSERQQTSLTWVRHVRHGLATIGACYAISLVPRLDTASEALTLTSATAIIATLMTPDALTWVIHRVAKKRLVMRLTTRSMLASFSRHATTAMALTLSVSVCVGVLAATATFVEVQRQHQDPTSLPGQVALDNDDTPFLPVDRAVINAAESVSAMRNQKPVQLYTVGRLTKIPGTQSVDLAGELSAPGGGLALAFETVRDVERVAGRALTAQERAGLTDGGVLVIDPSVQTSSGRVDLIDDDTGQVAVPAVKSVAAEFEPTPWFVAISSVMLVKTADAIGRPVSTGALIYTGISDADAIRVLKALSDSGISPEQADIHSAAPKLLPPAALLATSAGLFLIVLLLAVAAVRGQVALMRPWASRLTQLGVRSSWAKSAIRRQFFLVTAASVPLGIIAGLGPLLFSRLLVPTMPIVVPWEAVGALLGSLAAAITVAAWLSARTLTARESLGLLDLGA